MNKKVIEDMIKGLIVISRYDTVHIILGIDWKVYKPIISLIGFLDTDGKIDLILN